ncbi:MAG: hypothetical protein UIQ90_07295 [Eisenbergiella sp.]|mgnify:CR=1 FL=1
MKKLIVLLLAASMTASLTACGGSSTQGSTAANTESSVESEIASETAAPEETVTESLSETETATGETGTDSSESISSPEADLLNSIYTSFAEDQKFPIGGGDSANLVMDAPGAFDITNVEELESSLGFPSSQAANIDGAASMIHMMNANTFTGAAYHLIDGADADAFAEAVKETVLAKQWICGMPDTLVILSADDYIITAYGNAELIENFKTTALSAVSGSEVILETPITE